VTSARHILKNIRRTLGRALEHDTFNTAKAAAYSGMMCFFPAVLVFAALVSVVPEGLSVLGEMRGSLEEVLPPGTMLLLQNSLTERPLGSVQVLLSATSVSVFAALGVMLTLMDGFRRAYGVERDNWRFWEKRIRALMLVPIVLVPLGLASLLVVFGHQIEIWTIERGGHELRRIVLIFWRMARWTVAVTTGASVLAALYHFGTKRTEHWGRVLTGAIATTLVWFPATLAFGWYVTRVADYSRFYGSFAAGIATLVWLYLTCFSVLLGAELNGVLYQDRVDRLAHDNTADTVSSL
jgi:membrane protein